MKQIRTLLLVVVFGSLAKESLAQFTLSGEIRPRAEYRNGYKMPMDSSQTNAFFIDQRTRLNFGYKISDYEFYVAVQDYRIWGNTGQMNLSDGFLAIHEAWAKANFNDKWGLKLGRQEIKYDDDRIMGNVDWAQQARSHDAAVLQFKTDKTKLDFGVAFNQNATGLNGTNYTGPSTYRDMYYGWFNRKLGKKVDLSLLALTLGRQVDKTDTAGNPTKIINYVATTGTHTKFDFGKFKMALNGFYQFGSDVATYTNSQNVTGSKGYAAYLFGLDMNYAVKEEFNIILGYEAQSGTSQTDTTDAYNSVNRNFNPVFGTNHKFNGYMDYFYVGSGHGNAGLQDAYLKFSFKKKEWTFGLDAHMFLTGLGVDILDNDSYTAEVNKLITAGDFTGATALKQRDFVYKPYLGTEIDLTIATKINKSVKIVGGFSYMLASPTLYALKGVNYYDISASGSLRERDVPQNMWGYVMVVFKPTFLDGKKE